MLFRSEEEVLAEVTARDAAPPPMASGSAAQPIANDRADTIAEEPSILPLADPILRQPELARSSGKDIPRVDISCTNLDQVRRLCGDVMRGMTSITVRARCEMTPGTSVVVGLELPDEMVVSIDARVIDRRARNNDGKRPYHLDLTGFGGDEVAYLLARSEEHSPRSSQSINSLPRDSDTAELETNTAPRASTEEVTSEPRIPVAMDADQQGLAPSGPKISWS